LKGETLFSGIALHENRRVVKKQAKHKTNRGSRIKAIIKRREKKWKNVLIENIKQERLKRSLLVHCVYL
jgi:hypothetical protein